MINFLFLKVLNMSITASVVILFVLAARFLLRRLPKIFSYLLWGVVIFRLICPVSFTVPFSLLDLTNPKSVENGEVIYISSDIINLGESDAAGNVLNDGSEVLKQNNMNSLTERAAGSRRKTVISVMAYIWLLGILGMAGYSIISFVQLKRKLVGAVKCAENVWISDYVSFSFVMGIFRPRIYLWSGLSKEEKGFVIAHEETHIKRRDDLVKLFFYLVLIVHWFNPLVWLSYFLCMKDMEMSCDENVMKEMGRDIRADYSESLLSLASGRKIFAGTPLFFGEGDTKSRIKNILGYRKPTVWAVAAGVVVLVVLGIGFIGNPSERASGQDGGDIEDESTDHSGVEITESSTGMFEVRYPQIEFPSQTMNPFTVRLLLPQGWVIGERDLEAEDIVNLDVKEILGAFLTTYIFDEDGICVGKMGCNFYEIYEGAEDLPQAIYNQVALGNHYQFDVRNSYEIISRSNMIETATADVLHMESANDGGNVYTNYGILSRSREDLVYVALELESGLVSKEDVTALAESISFEILLNSED